MDAEDQSGQTGRQGDGGGGRLMKSLDRLGIDRREAKTASEMLTILLARRKADRAGPPDPANPTLSDFFAYALPRVARAQGQLFQDLWVLFELGDLQPGYFVDFGATNGVTMSNSHLLEKHHGWQGILAEPNPEYHERLGRERGARISHKCVYSRSGLTMDFLCTQQGTFSRLADIAPGDRHETEKRMNPRTIAVETITLEDLLQEHGAPETIDYLSVDTEGSELEILQAFDFSRRFVRCLTVEHNYTPMREALHELLTAQGYVRRFPEFSRFDDWYVHREARTAG